MTFTISLVLGKLYRSFCYCTVKMILALGSIEHSTKSMRLRILPTKSCSVSHIGKCEVVLEPKVPECKSVCAINSVCINKKRACTKHVFHGLAIKYEQQAKN